MKCIKCGNAAADYPFHVLQVQTLHVRDLGGEKRVQALGDFEDYCVCRSCAEEKYRSIMENKAALRKALLPYAMLILFGIAAVAAFWTRSGAFRLLGFGMLVCGILGTYATAKSAAAKQKEVSALDQEQAMCRCAWECVVDCAPKKNDVNDITYIPITEETLARKNGDLMLLYDLLPEIAIEAHKRIHEHSQ